MRRMTFSTRDILYHNAGELITYILRLLIVATPFYFDDNACWIKTVSAAFLFSRQLPSICAALCYQKAQFRAPSASWLHFAICILDWYCARDISRATSKTFATWFHDIQWCLIYASIGILSASRQYAASRKKLYILGMMPAASATIAVLFIIYHRRFQVTISRVILPLPLSIHTHD